MKKNQIEAKIISNKQAGHRYFKIELCAGIIAAKAMPGQFVMVKPQNCIEPLLRRPLGVHSIRGKNIELLYEVVGPATRILSHKKPGETVGLIGPLGSGFDYRSQSHLPVRQAGKVAGTQVLVAGGMGVAPLIFLAEKLKEIQNPKSKIPNLVLIGAKTKSHILCLKEFKKLGCDVKIATDDGSAGFKGRVTELLDNLLQGAMDAGRGTIYACGPHLMLEALHHVAQKYKIPAQVSLEEHMSCGFGACLGCAVNTVVGYKQVCKDGPVFDTQDIVW